MDAQLKRGVLDSAVLSVLNRNDSYGYAIIKEIEPVMTISESTLYPILKRLELQKQVICYSREYQGRLRKYYSITKEGRIALLNFLEEWKELVKVCEFIAQGRGSQDE